MLRQILSHQYIFLTLQVTIVTVFVLCTQLQAKAFPRRHGFECSAERWQYKEQQQKEEEKQKQNREQNFSNFVIALSIFNLNQFLYIKLFCKNSCFQCHKTVGRKFQSHARLAPSRYSRVLGEMIGCLGGLGRAKCHGEQGRMRCAYVRDLMARTGANVNGLGTITNLEKMAIEFPVHVPSNGLVKPPRLTLVC